MTFKSLVVKENGDGKFEREIVNREIDDLPAGEILVKVLYSALNYKDALSATGNKGITRVYPHTPGIDAAGVVAISRNENFGSDDEVIITGYDLGMNTSGGFSEYIRVPASWVVMKPPGYTLKEFMILGTAGFTAASALYKMELIGLVPEAGTIVVTGASGGVGSIATAILSTAGYEVIAITGKAEATEYLLQLGATTVKGREFVQDKSKKNLLKPQWAGAIDTVGGNTLTTLLKACKPDGSVVSTGMVQSPMLETSIYPFILNGVNLLGVGSAETPMDTRLKIWELLSTKWNIQEKLSAIGTEVTLEELNKKYIDDILNARTRGRIVVKM